MIQSCSKKVLLIRHAESEYNLAVRKLDRDAFNYVEEKRKVMLDNSLIDCGITEEGVKQCKEVSQKLTELKIDVVLVSPLRRAIQTAHHLFYRHPRQPKLVVHPIVREMIGFSSDVGGQLIQTMNEYPHFDYSLILSSEFSQQYPNLWSIEHLWNKYSHGPLLFTQYLSEQNQVESFKDTMERVEKARGILCEYENAACVTHFRVLQIMSSGQIEEDWHNCEFNTIEL